jgi:acetolactate synthase-1/2/3 large subunit
MREPGQAITGENDRGTDEFLRPPAEPADMTGETNPSGGESGSRDPDGDDDTKTGGEYIYEALLEAGVEVVVGLPGTQTLPIDRTIIKRDDITYVMARHETAIPHVAWGYFESGGGPAATLTVPGPGDTNAMHGLKNALEDCVPLVHVSADVDPEDRGQKPIHELDPASFDGVVKANLNVETPQELSEKAARAVSVARTPPYGPVRLGVPSGILGAAFRAPEANVTPEAVTFENPGAYAAAADRLSRAERPVVYVGGGCRRSPVGVEPVRDLVRALDAPVVATMKGKGVFPEDDDRFLGVAASFLPAGGERVLGAADVVLALGTDFDGVATAGWDLPMGESLVHVNLDPGEIDATPYTADVAIVDDAGRATERLRGAVDPDRTDAWNGAAIGRRVREEYRQNLGEMGLLDHTEPARTPATLLALREAIPAGAIVTTDIGGFRLWALELFEVTDPEWYVTAGSWAGMGVGLPSALGAALANPDRPVVSLTGDGGFLMCLQELHTLAERDLDVTVVVFDNGDYGTISKSDAARAFGDGSPFAWESPDFAAIAEGFGVPGVDASTPEAAADAVAATLGRGGPGLVNVEIDPKEPSEVDGSEYVSTVELS